MTVYPKSKQIAPMKYANIPSHDKVDTAMVSKDWVIQEKFDGAWYMLEKIDNDTIYLFGRTTSKATGELTEKSDNVPHIIEWAKANLPDETVLIGEIYVPHGHSNDVTKVMGCLSDKAIQRQKKQGYVEYHIFDCIMYNGIDLCGNGFLKRYKCLIDNIQPICTDNIVTVPIYTLDSISWIKQDQILQDNFQDKINEIFSKGGEGVVFKQKDSPYRPGMRTTSSQMFKMKEHIDSIDLIVTEVLPPEKVYTGKEVADWPYWDGDIPVTKPWYYGWNNALRLGAYNDKGEIVNVGKVASGLSDAERANLGSDPDSYIGSVCQISCMSVNKKDLTIRHPVFQCWRPDKDAKDCLLSEIFMDS